MRIRTMLILLFLYSIAAAQNNRKKQLRFNNLFLKDDLIEGQVYQMEQDEEGYMWFGTRRGLVRFDGYSPKTYQFKTRIMARSNISAIFKDKKGNLLVSAAYEGLFYYDPGKDTFMHVEADSINEKLLQASIIKNIRDDADGNLWLNLSHNINSVSENDAYQTIMYYNIKTHRFINFSNTEKGNRHVKYKQYLSPLVTDNSGKVWCGSDSGLYKYDKKSNGFKPVIIKGSLSSADISQLAFNPARPELIWLVADNHLLAYNTLQKSVEVMLRSEQEAFGQLLFDSNNQLWFSGTDGLSCFDDQAKKFITYKTGSVNHFKEDLPGGFWCQTSRGLLYFDKRAKSFFTYSPGENPNGLFGYPGLIFTDKDGTLWTSVFSAGVQWVNKQSSSIEQHEMPENLSYGVNAFAEANDSTFWLVTDAGLYHWIPKADSFVKISPKNRYQSGFGSVFCGSNNNIWFGGAGENNGVFCYNLITKKITNYRYSKNDTASVGGARIGDLLEDKKGNIWIGTWSGGVCMLDVKKKKIRRFPFIINLEKTPNEKKLDDKDALSLYQDKTGVLWIGTNAGSLNRFDEETQSFTSYQNTNNRFRCIVNINEDKKGRLWAGTYAAGLFLLDRKNDAVQNISLEDGLLSDNSGGLIIDDNNNIWLNSAKGISIYNPKTGQTRTITNAIVQLNFAPFCSLKTREGAFIFPANNGFVLINPNDFKPDSTTPVVHIQSIVYNKPQSKNKSFDSAIVRYGKDKIELRYDENRLTFNYVGLIYQNVEQVRYKYKLDGYDNYWVNANTQRTVTYTNLAPGTYRFHVTASNGDGIWSKKDDSIIVIIAPPFWQTVWFRILTTLIIAGLTLMAVKIYLKRRIQAQQREFDKLKAIEKVRSKISMDIHDEISSGLTKISLLSQRVENRFENNKEIEPDIIRKINNSSKEVITNLSEIIWAVNPKHDNLQSLLAYIRNYAFTFFEQTSIHLNINFPDDVNGIVVSPDIKRNLFLVIKEGLNNIIKHSNASRAEFNFTCTHQSYQFIIKDSGNGIDDMNGRTFGNGLANMKNRMAAIKGTISFQSEKNKGTSLIIEGQF